jgi:hypothetical protein
VAELIGRAGAYGGKLTGQPAAYVAYFMFAAMYVTLIYQGKTSQIPEDFRTVFYILTGWFFANAITWKLQEDMDRVEQLTETEVKKIVEDMVE